MQKKSLSTFLKFLIIGFIVLVACLLVFRNHFIFGTALIIGRWGFVVIGLLLLFFTTKRITPKRLQYTLLASLILIGFEFIFAQLNKASLEEVPITRAELSLLTYNLFFKNNNPDVILNQIKQTDPDILVVQELTPAWASILSNALGKQYLYKRIYTDKGTHGIGVYSKYKISNDTLLLNDNKKPFAQIITMRIFNKKIRLINTHTASPAAAVEHPENFFSLFSTNYTTRENQFEQIEQILKNDPDEICFLIGDLNTTPYEPIYRNLRTTWVDLFTKTGEGDGSTFPNTSKAEPFLRIDYILIKGPANPISAKLLNSGSSDHLGLLGKVRI